MPSSDTPGHTINFRSWCYRALFFQMDITPHADWRPNIKLRRDFRPLEDLDRNHLVRDDVFIGPTSTQAVDLSGPCSVDVDERDTVIVSLEILARTRIAGLLPGQ